LSVVAQNLELEIEAINGATITKVHHEGALALQAGKRYRVPYHDLYGEETRDVLVGLRLPSGGEIRDSALPEAQFLRTTLRYIDVLAGASASTSTSIGARRKLGNLPLSKRVKDPRIELQATRLRVVDTINSARARAEGGDFARARAEVQEVQASLKGVMERCHMNADAEALNLGWQENLRECAEGLVDVSHFRLAKHKMANIQQMNLQQRSMANCAERAGTYGTKSKMSRASKFKAPSLFS